MTLAYALSLVATHTSCSWSLKSGPLRADVCKGPDGRGAIGGPREAAAIVLVPLPLGVKSSAPGLPEVTRLWEPGGGGGGRASRGRQPLLHWPLDRPQRGVFCPWLSDH